jgi:heptosyltransferase-2
MRAKLPETIESVVWLQTSFIGDCILTTGAAALLQEMNPGLKQIIITTPVGEQGLRGQPLFDAVLLWDKRREGLIYSARRLRNVLRQMGVLNGRTVLIQPHRSARSSFLAFGLGLPVVTYEETRFSFLAARRLPRVALFHEAVRIALLTQPLGVSRSQIARARPRLAPLAPQAAGWHEELQPLLSKNYRLIGVAPGSVWGTKRWPAESYARLVSSLLAEPDTAVVLLGSPNERRQAEIIQTFVTNTDGRFVDLVGKTSLTDLSHLYGQLHLLVSNDSSPIHYASSLGVPTVAIFGATVSAMGFGPLAHGSRVVEMPIDTVSCRPCSDHGPQTCPLGHFRCMREISSDLVLTQVKEVLGALG